MSIVLYKEYTKIDEKRMNWLATVDGSFGYDMFGTKYDFGHKVGIVMIEHDKQRSVYGLNEINSERFINEYELINDYVYIRK
jgi:hypothetical protein